MPKQPMDRRSAIRAAATGGIALAAGTLAATVPATSASAAVTAADDPAIAGLIGTATSQTRGALNALYPVYRVWDAVANTYPPRVAGVVNIFVGPNPGLLMQDADLWADPNLIAIDDVTAAMSTVGSPLRTVTQSFVTPASLFIPASDFVAVDNRAAGAFKPFSAANVSAGTSGWFFPKTENPYVSAIVRIPDGWNTASVRLYLSHTTAAPDGVCVWRVRVQPFAVGGALQVTPSGMSFVRSYTPGASRVIDQSGPFSTAINAAALADSRLYMVVVNRQITDAADTTTHPIALIGAELTRLS